LDLRLFMQLFGGYINASLPIDVIDLNDDPSFHQDVPDTQEVFRYTHSNAVIIIEVLSKVVPEDDVKPVRIVFDSLAPINAAASSTVDVPPEISLEQIKRKDAIILTGTHHIAKDGRHPDRLDQIRIALCLFNTVDEHNDLVVSFNVPVTSVSLDGADEMERIGWDRAKKDFIELVASLTVQPGLFKLPSDL